MLCVLPFIWFSSEMSFSVYPGLLGNYHEHKSVHASRVGVLLHLALWRVLFPDVVSTCKGWRRRRLGQVPGAEAERCSVCFASVGT